MPSNRVTVIGTVRGVNGLPYEGALVEAYLNSQMSYDTSLYGNEVVRTFSNTYGRFSFSLIPSSYDSDRENYYTFKIIKDTTNVYRKIVRGVSSTVNFEDLEDYIPPGQRAPLLGNLNQGMNNNPITLPQELVGSFIWNTTQANGVTSVFSAQNEIFFVALNGVVQSPGVDYIKRSPNVIEFNNTPLSGDLVSIQYRLI